MAKKKEQTGNTETAVATVSTPSPAMVALFAASGAEAKLAKLERRNMPQMFKPSDVPIGGIVSGEIIKVVDSPVTTVKGMLLWLRHESGQEYTFPCTGVIRNALAPGKKEGKELTDALDKEVGKMFYAKRLENKPSKYNADLAGKVKKEMFMFDVFTSNK